MSEPQAKKAKVSDRRQATKEDIEALAGAILEDDVDKVASTMRTIGLRQNETAIGNNLETDSGACAGVWLLGTFVYQDNYPDFEFTTAQGEKKQRQHFSECWDGEGGGEQSEEWKLTVLHFARHVNSTTVVAWAIEQGADPDLECTAAGYDGRPLPDDEEDGDDDADDDDDASDNDDAADECDDDGVTAP